MKKRKQDRKRISGVPLDAKLVAKDPGSSSGELWIGKDGAVYLVRLERVTYRLIGGV